MASLPKSAPVRRLHELLKEKQEPFLLDVYLLEKGYSKKDSLPETRNRSRLKKSYKKQISCGLSGRKEGLPKSSKLLKSVLTRFVSGKYSKTQKSCKDGRFDAFSGVSEIWKKTQVAELKWFSSDSRREDSSSSSEKTVFSSPDGHQALKLRTLKQQAAAGKSPWRRMEECKQFSPVSVLEVPSDEGSPVQDHKTEPFYPRTCREESSSTLKLNLPDEVLEDSILSASLWDLIMNSTKEKHGFELLGSAFPFQFTRTRQLLQQTKQLLFDCVREVVENHEIHSRRWNIHEYVGPEMLGKIICDKMLSWGKHDGDAKSLTQLLESDIEDSKQWSHFQPLVKEIGMELGDGILEIFIDEIVTELLDFELK